MDPSVLSSEALAAPRCPRLPEQPSDFWNDSQWAVFMALVDTIVPAIVPKSSLNDRQGQLAIPDSEYSAVIKTALHAAVETPDEDSLRAFLEARPSTDAPVRASMVRLLARLSKKQRNGLGGFLSALSSRGGAFLLTGSCVPFHQQPVHVRESIIQGWAKAWFPTKRRIIRALVRIAQVCWLMTSPVFAHVTGYPEVPLNWKPGPDFDFAFLQFPPQAKEIHDQPRSNKIPTETTIETDVVIVGSGCGGAVCAKILAEAGHKVIVVDKGYYFPPSMLPMPGAVASRYLFDTSVAGSVDNSINVVAAATWGGGGTVNWSVSLRTPDFVRKEWAAQGLDFFDSPGYQECMDRVCDRMGVSSEAVVQTHRGRALLEGCRRLGWRAEVCPQNSGGKEHSCGHCTMGCASGEKQGPTRSWLPDAAKAGAEFIEGFTADRLLFEEAGGSTRATGLVGKWTSRDATGSVSGPLDDKTTREVTIKAKRVIVACGALHSPLLLTKSGLTNPNIGRNLHLHPCNHAGGFYPEDTRPWEGTIMSSYCSEFDNLDGQGHGIYVETTNMTPHICLSTMPWQSGLDFKLAALRYRHYAQFISVARDRDTGCVSADPVTGRPRIDYTPSALDRAHALEGVLAICKILYVTGATEINSFMHEMETFVRNDDDSSEPEPETSADRGPPHEQIQDARFLAWLDKVRELGSTGPETRSPFSSAHQMGTCRMAVSADSGVVDQNGKVWGMQGLYVADSSVFPSASGANPMITVMAIADHIARAVDGDLKGDRR